MGGVAKKVKKVVKKVTKVVKKVVKGVGKVAKKVWKGVKGAVKKIGKAVKKMGPLASIAIGFIPGFQALWANAGIWGAMGKGAITGFITSGGKLKGALIGAAGGAIGHAANAGIEAYQKGYGSLGESASISDKIAAGFKSVGNSTVEGVSNMYNSASDIMTSGDFSKVNYLTDTGESVYKYGTDVENPWVEVKGADGTVDWEIDPAKQGKSIYDKANESYMKELQGNLSEYDKEFLSKNKDYFSQYNKRQMNEIMSYAEKTGENLEHAEMLWDATGGTDLDMSFDYTKMDNGAFQYTGEGLKHTLGSFGYPATGVKDINKKKTPDLADAAKSLFAPGESSSLASLPFSTEDTGDQYDAAGGLLAMSGGTGTALDFAQNYGGALGGSAYADKAAQEARRRYNI